MKLKINKYIISIAMLQGLCASLHGDNTCQIATSFDSCLVGQAGSTKTECKSNCQTCCKGKFAGCHKTCQNCTFKECDDACYVQFAKEPVRSSCLNVCMRQCEKIYPQIKKEGINGPKK
jgi:hypothetical protein